MEEIGKIYIEDLIKESTQNVSKFKLLGLEYKSEIKTFYRGSINDSEKNSLLKIVQWTKYFGISIKSKIIYTEAGSKYYNKD